MAANPIDSELLEEELIEVMKEEVTNGDWDANMFKKYAPYLADKKVMTFMKALAEAESGTFELDQKQIPYCQGDRSLDKDRDACVLKFGEGGDNGWVESSAQGLFQFIDGTAKNVQKKTGFDPRSTGKKYSALEQTLAAIYLIDTKTGALEAVSSGNYDLASRKLRGIWEALPSNYGGKIVGRKAMGLPNEKWQELFKKHGGTVIKYQKLTDEEMEGALHEYIKKNDPEKLAEYERYQEFKNNINPKIQKFKASVDSIISGDNYTVWWEKNKHNGKSLKQWQDNVNYSDSQLKELERWKNGRDLYDKGDRSANAIPPSVGFSLYNKSFGEGGESTDYEEVKSRAEKLKRESQDILIKNFESRKNFLKGETMIMSDEIRNYVLGDDVSELLGSEGVTKILNTTRDIQNNINSLGDNIGDYDSWYERNSEIISKLEAQKKKIDARPEDYVPPKSHTSVKGGTSSLGIGSSTTKDYTAAEIAAQDSKMIGDLIGRLKEGPGSLEDMEMSFSLLEKTGETGWGGLERGEVDKEILKKYNIDESLLGSEIDKVFTDYFNDYKGDKEEAIKNLKNLDPTILGLPEGYKTVEAYDLYLKGIREQIDKENKELFDEEYGESSSGSSVFGESSNIADAANTPPTMTEDEFKEYLEKVSGQREEAGISKIYKHIGDGSLDTALQFAGMLGAYKSATAPLPKQQKSEDWKNHMRELSDRRHLGLDAATLTYYQRNAERVYSHDVDNIARFGTSGQAVLASLGRAARDKYDAQLKIAALDEEAKQKHFTAYGQGLAQDEAMTQSYWKTNVYDQADRKRELKAAIIGQLTNNLREDQLYARQYGEGSYYANLMDARYKDTRESTITKRASELKLRGGTLPDGTEVSYTDAQALKIAESENPYTPAKHPKSLTQQVGSAVLGGAKGVSALIDSADRYGSTLASGISQGVANLMEKINAPVDKDDYSSYDESVNKFRKKRKIKGSGVAYDGGEDVASMGGDRAWSSLTWKEKRARKREHKI